MRSSRKITDPDETQKTWANTENGGQGGLGARKDQRLNARVQWERTLMLRRSERCDFVGRGMTRLALSVTAYSRILCCVSLEAPKTAWSHLTNIKTPKNKFPTQLVGCTTPHNPHNPQTTNLSTLMNQRVLTATRFSLLKAYTFILLRLACMA